MTFLLCAEVHSDKGDGKAWWIAYDKLTPEALIALIEERKKTENILSLIPTFIYDFGGNNEPQE